MLPLAFSQVQIVKPKKLLELHEVRMVHCASSKHPNGLLNSASRFSAGRAIPNHRAIPGTQGQLAEGGSSGNYIAALMALSFRLCPFCHQLSLQGKGWHHNMPVRGGRLQAPHTGC